MRIVHESLAIRINVPRFTKRDIDALRGCLAAWKRWPATTCGSGRASTANSISRCVAHAGDRLMRTIRELYDHADRYRWLYIKGVPRALSIAAEEHKAIFDASVTAMPPGGGPARPSSGAHRPDRADPSRAGARSDDGAGGHPSGDRRRGGTGL